MDNQTSIIIGITIVIVIIALVQFSRNKRKLLKEKLNQKFPDIWREILQNKVLYYTQLNNMDKKLFEKRIQLFLATKNIEGIDTKIDDTIRLMVASSSIIPTFAFPRYNYPNVNTVLIYPNSFDDMFQTKRFKGHKEFISGMVGNRFMDGTVILSKPDLLQGFNGIPHKNNVGIHEFVHLLDKEDGEIDGLPKVFIDQNFVGPWLLEIKKEMKKIEKGNSDINPYALSNNAEFLAVVSEYFFDNPEKFQKRHPTLYRYLCTIFGSDENVEKPR